MSENPSFSQPESGNPPDSPSASASPAHQQPLLSRSLMDALFETSAAGISVADLEGRLLRVNQSYCAFFGYRPQELLGQPFTIVLQPEQSQRAWAMHQALLASGQELTGEWSALSRDGSRRDLRLNCRLLHDAGQTYIVTTLWDIGESKKIRSLLEETQKAAGIGGWEFELGDGGLQWTAETYQIYGLPETVEPNQDLALRHFSPAARERLLAGIERTRLSGEGFETELEFTRSDGEKIWIRITCRPEYLENRVVRLFGTLQDVTQRYLIAQELQRLSLVARQIPSMVAIADRHFAIEYSNDAYQLETGYSPNQLLGQSPLHLKGEATDAEALARIGSALARHQEIHEEILLYTRTGRPFWCELLITPVFDRSGSPSCYIVLQNNISDRKRREALLEFQADILAHVSDSLIVVDIDGIVTYWNRGAENLFGYEADEMVGYPLSRLSSDFDMQDFVSRCLAGANPYAASPEVRRRHKSGADVWITLRLDLIFDSQNEPIGAIGIAKDVTDKKRMELTMQQNSASFQLAQKQAELEKTRLIQELTRQNEDLSQFTYIISHNLRAPVANLLGLVDLLELGTDAGGQVLQSLGVTAGKLDEVIRDLNQILNVRSPRSELCQTVNLAEELDKALETLSLQHPNARNWVRLELRQNQTESIRPYIQSICFNLLSNALKYRHPEREPEIRVRSWKQQDLVVVEFCDNGLGIDLARYRSQLFRLYKRFHAHIEGRGLGLYLIKTQAEALGGGIEVSSEPGKGACFKVYFKESCETL